MKQEPHIHCSRRPIASRRTHGARVFRSIGGLAIAACLVLVSANPVCGAEPISVQKFVEMESQWRRFGENGIQFVIEGRVSSMSAHLLRFRKCSMSFMAAEGVEFPRRYQRTESVQVDGGMDLLNGKPVFLVRKLTELRPDLDRFRSQKVKLDDRQIDRWYEFADVLLKRSKFYDDPELAKLASEIQVDALRIETRSLKRDDTDGLRKMAAKAKRLGAGDRFYLELVHRALWKERNSGVATVQLLGRIRRDLEGSNVALDPPQPQMATRYFADPLTEFQRANESDRKKLARILWTDVWMKNHLKKAEANGSNGDVIADQIDSEVPEQHDLAEEYRDKWLKFRTDNIGDAPRSAVLKLAGVYRDREENEKAEETLRKWIHEREVEWRSEGPLGTVRLAEEYLDLLEDRATAILLLRQAYARSGNDPEIAQRLRSLGVAIGGAEVAAADTPSDGDGQKVDSPIRVGMTREQVKRVLGSPDDRVRLASSGEVTEIWTFGARGTARLTVRFTRRLDQARPISKVAAVSRIDGK